MESMLLTTPEAASILDISPRTLEKSRSHGDGPPFYKIGRSVKYRKDEVEAWLASRKQTSTSGSQCIGGHQVSEHLARLRNPCEEE